MKLSVSVSILFGTWGQKMEMDVFLKSMETVKKAGYDGIEFLNWWDVDLDAVAEKKKELGLEVATIMMRNGTLGDPKEKEPFLAELKATRISKSFMIFIISRLRTETCLKQSA